MGTKVIRLNSTASDALKTQLKILNGIANLTPKELEVLEALIRHDPVNPATTEVRKKIVEEMNFPHTQSLNNIIRALKMKGVLIRKPYGGYEYHSLLPTLNNFNQIVFQLTYEG